LCNVLPRRTIAAINNYIRDIMRRSTIGLAAALLLISALRSTPLHAQELDSRGKEFWVAFLPTDGADESPQYAIVVTAPAGGAHGTITYMATGGYFPVAIPAGGAPLHIALDSTWLIPFDPRAKAVGRTTLHVQFDTEVALVGVNMQRWSSDAFMGIPADALGTRYLVLAYPNTLSANPGSDSTKISDFPSEFSVVATSDSTKVTINAPVRINGQAGRAPIAVTLNRGEIFTGQATGLAGTDASGTEIVASKPVAVYAGHERANVPYNRAVGRDHLAEQLPPVELWGTEAIVTPHAQIEKTLPDSNIVRVIAAADGTHISVDDLEKGTLNKGEVMEFLLDRPMHITGSDRILVAEYHGSVLDERLVKISNDTIGDPFMTVLPAPSQFDSSYGFESFGAPNFDFSFANVIAPSASTGALWLDGVHIDPVEFIPVPGTGYSYAQLPLTPGVHTMHGDARFGLNLYGYGPFNSYGYVAGANYAARPSAVERADASRERVNLRVLPSIVRGDRARAELDLAHPGDASLFLYDARGECIRTLARGDHFDAGKRSLDIDLDGLASGMYFLHFLAEDGAAAVAPVALVR
jgi:hypothetical protein